MQPNRPAELKFPGSVEAWTVFARPINDIRSVVIDPGSFDRSRCLKIFKLSLLSYKAVSDVCYTVNYLQVDDSQRDSHVYQLADVVFVSVKHLRAALVLRWS